ncbi:MAG TPA: hypothetical protein VFT46_10405 [Holophagaceae bacterium]|nr:hypothetical protein [Holophagaceae bacterium]
MPRLKLDGLFEQLAPELQRALASAVRELHPEVTVDDYALYRAFQRAARRAAGDSMEISSRHLES